MASSIDFVVKNGLQVSTNIVVGTYTLNNTPISNGAIISGNVGIGTFNPTSQLHVYGNIKVSNTATSGGIIFPDGTFQNTSASGSTVYLNDDTTTNATRYLTFANATSGILTTLNTSSTKLTYNPLLATVNLTGGNLTVSNSTQVGNLSITNTTAATSTTSGALTVAGGVGVSGNVFAGSNMLVAGQVGIGTTLPASTLYVAGKQIISNVFTSNTMVYTDKSLDVSVQETGPGSPFFSPDGKILYFTGTGGNDVTVFTLTTPWDISTAAFLGQSASLAAQNGNPYSVFFDPTGKKMWMTGYTATANILGVYEYDLATPWNIFPNSLSYTQSNLNVTSSNNVPRQIYWKPDGTALFLVGSGTGTYTDSVMEFSPVAPWTIAGMSNTVVNSFSVAGQESNPLGLNFTNDGSTMLITGSTGDDITVYDLSTPWNITTARHRTQFSLSNLVSNITVPTGAYLKPDGSTIYVTNDLGSGTGNVVIYQFDLGNNSRFDLVGNAVMSGDVLMLQNATVAGQLTGWQANFNGNVGIGTTTASYGLDVASSALFRSNVSISNTTNATSSTTGALVVTGGIGVSGNIHIAEQIVSTRANNSADNAGQIYLNGANGNRIDFNNAGIAPPSFTTRSAGTKLVLYPGVAAGSVDYALGIDSSVLWFSVGSTTRSFKWYGGTTLAATLAGDGDLTLTGSLSTINGTFTGQITSTRTNNTADGGGQIYLNGTGGNRIDFNSAGLAVPAFTTRSVGTRIVLYPSLSGTGVDYGLGMASGTLWLSVANTSNFFRWYGGTTLAATLTGTGDLTLVGGSSIAGIVNITNTTASSSSTTGALTVAGGTGISGNLYVGGNLVVQGNVTYLNTNVTVIEDPVITIGTGPNGANLTTADTYDRGLEFHYYSGAGDRYGFIGWQNSTGRLTYISNAAGGSATQVYSGPFGDAQFGNIVVGGVSNTPEPSTTTGTGAITIGGTGGIGLGGNINAGGNIYTAQGFNAAGLATVNYLISNTGISSTVLNITGGLSASTITSNNWINGASITSSGTISAAGQITGQSLYSNSTITGDTISAFTLNSTDINASGVVALTGITANTVTTSATTGALTVAGGIATQSNLWVSASTWLNNLSIISSNVSTSTTTGALTVAGGVGIAGNVFAGSNMFVSSNVGIGTTVPVSGYVLTVNGGLAATTKSFVIPHPTRAGMKLQYASLEGPENGVYIRGKLEDNDTIILPDYWQHLIDPDTITAHLTPYGSAQSLYVKDISIKSITVASSSWLKSIKCFYTVYAERKDVPKLKVEI